jgi:hypothetical protein
MTREEGLKQTADAVREAVRNLNTALIKAARRGLTVNLVPLPSAELLEESGVNGSRVYTVTVTARV